jgi:hypothetical protein
LREIDYELRGMKRAKIEALGGYRRIMYYEISTPFTAIAVAYWATGVRKAQGKILRDIFYQQHGFSKSYYDSEYDSDHVEHFLWSD